MPAVEYLDVPTEPGWYQILICYNGKWIRVGCSQVEKYKGEMVLHGHCLTPQTWRKFVLIPEPPMPPMENTNGN